MGELKKYSQETDLHRYLGNPRSSAPGEKSNWKKFVSFIIPWLNQKRILAEDFLQVKVDKEKAEVINILADALVKIQEAKKIAIQAKQIEIEKLPEQHNFSYTEDDFQKQLKHVEDLISYLSSVHGFKISIEDSRE